MSLEKVRDTVPSGVILENETVGGMGFLSLDAALCLALESSSENLNPPSDPSGSRE
jgi:hypothetical protein